MRLTFGLHAFCKPATLRTAQRGFTLIEVMITIIVVTVGLLGMAAMQVITKKNNFEAVQRTAATALANDIIERMRVNPSQLPEYAGNKGSPPPILGGASLGSSKPSADCATTNCSAYQLSQYDLWEWEQMLDGASEIANGDAAGGLTLPTACLSTDVPAGVVDRSGMYTVAIAWRGAAKLADPYPNATATDPEACGRNSGKYNDEDGNLDVHRRVLVVRTFITTH